jgi:hypothetical protein
MAQQFRWKRGDTSWFEYHCYEGHDSADAELWYHSHQRVTVVKLEWRGVGVTVQERAANGCSAGYRVRFSDGHTGDAFEDELLFSRRQFVRPDPPAK